MNYKVLYIFVEGDDDERFFQEILLSKLKRRYNEIKIIKYSQKPKKFEYIKKLIHSILCMGNEYILVIDINNSPCVTEKIRKIKNKLKNVEKDKILVVINEIESWYLAGLDMNIAKNLGIKKIPKTTEDLTKEQFYNLIPKKFSKIDFMREVLKNFSIKIAKQRNKSFKYFLEKYA